MRLRVDRPGQVLSGQIETDADVEVLDRNLHIATVGEGGKLNIEMRLKTGRGYVAPTAITTKTWRSATSRSTRFIRPSAK